MPGAAAGPQQEAVDALLADAERVEAPPAELERRAPALVEDEVAAHGLRMFPAEPLSAGRRAHLLVRRHHQLQRAASRAPARAREVDRRGDLRGHLSLHVLGAATADLATGDVARPGVERPLVGIGRDRVHVSEQAEGLAVRVAGEIGDQVRPARFGCQQGAFEASVAQPLGQHLLRRLLVARRVHRVEADQLAEQFHRLGSQAP